MRRPLLVAVMTAAAWAGGASTAAAPPPDPVRAQATGRPTIFYSPHPDDETLFARWMIAYHAVANRDVHLVLGSNGPSPTPRAAINGETSSGWWGGYHYPAREGYAPITGEECEAARDREFTAAAGQLGVHPRNIHLERDTRGESITVAQATALIARYEALYPDAAHVTMWWGDNHPDHAALGQALRNLRAANPAAYSDVWWMVKPEQATAAGASRYTVPAASLPVVTRMARRAAYPYRSWAPQQGMYAVGYHSVGNSYFDDVERRDPNWVVRP